MEWLPELDIKEEYNEYLNDFELRKVKELHRTLRNHPSGPKRAEIATEIYNIYIAAIESSNKESEKLEKEKIWNQTLQKAFDELARIWAILVVTLLGGGIISAIYILVFNFVTSSKPASTTDAELSLGSFLFLSFSVSLIYIVVGLLSIRRMSKLKKRFQSGDMAVEIAKKSLQE